MTTVAEVRKTLESKDIKDHFEHIFRIQTGFADLCFSGNGIGDRKGETLNCQKIGDSAKTGKHGYNDLLVPWTWEMVRAMEDEIREIKILLPWKHWSKAQLGEKEHPKLSPEERLNLLRIELVDILHFLVEALAFTGLDAESTYQLYLRKCQNNVTRQEKLYNDSNKTDADDKAVAASFSETKAAQGSLF